MCYWIVQTASQDKLLICVGENTHSLATSTIRSAKKKKTMFLIQDFIDQDILKKKKIWYIILTSMLDDSKVASGLNVAQGPPIKYASLSSLNCLISETSSVNHFSIYTAMCTCLMVTLFVQCPERRTQSDVAHLPCVFEAFQQNVKITVFDECKRWHQPTMTLLSYSNNQV